MDMFEEQADNLVHKIKHYLITSMGRTLDEASDEEFYIALCWAIREGIMINWTATNHTLMNAKVRKAYYISLEYLPGRLLSNNLHNIKQFDLIQCVLKKLGKENAKVCSMEPEIGIGNGGLGRLASCFLDSLATQKYPALGYGMRYQYGIFEQELWCGVQVERPDCWLLHDSPWSFRRDVHAFNVHFAGRSIQGINKHGEEIFDLADYEEVRALPYDFPIVGYSPSDDYSVLTLRLWSTKESPRNFQLQRYNAGLLDEAAENTSLTDVLYPNDNNEMGKRMRLKQEFLLVSASLQDIIFQHLRTHGNMKDFADKVRIQVNDTHPTLIFPEMMRVLTTDFDYTWDEAFETVGEVCSYTNHTVLKEALEEWNQNRMHNLLPRQTRILEKMNAHFTQDIRKKFPNDEKKVNEMAFVEGGQVKMANLAIYCAHKTNGVAALHSEILKDHIFPEFNEMYPDRLVNVTNGVTQRRWLLNCNPRLAKFINERIGDGWVTDFSIMSKLADFASDKASQDEFLAIKKENKKALIHMMKQQVANRHCKVCEIEPDAFLDENALVDIHIKRIHEYKRQLMNAMHLLMLYHEIKKNPDCRKVKRLSLIGGKAAPGYDLAKNIIRFVYCLSRTISQDPAVKKQLRVSLIENYNVSKAEIIIPAADLSEQISTAGMEASGTGNMKLSMNGALTIGTDDGANVEMRQHVTDEWWPFMFGKSASYNYELHKSYSYDPAKICEECPEIREAVEALRNRSLVENDAEHEALCSLYTTLMEGGSRERPDYFFVLNDLKSYYDTQKKVEDLYIQPNKWAEYCLHNMAGMGFFSSDQSIQNYADNIWGIKPCPVDTKELDRVRREHSEVDRCRIFPEAG